MTKLNPANYTARDNLLKSRIIAITGAGDGIGRALARACGKLGATVILMGRTVKKLEVVYDELMESGACEPAIYPVELAGATPGDYQNLAQNIHDTFGRLDGLVHNAGILGTRSPLELYEPEEWVRVMHVNVNAAFFLTQALLPALKAADEASVIFTSSGVGRRGRAYWGAYAASKFATEGLMQVLADELENTHRIRVNSLNPGAVRTKMRASAYPAEDPNRLLTPDDIVGAYLYLLGEDGRGVHGQALEAQPIHSTRG